MKNKKNENNFSNDVFSFHIIVREKVQEKPMLFQTFVDVILEYQKLVPNKE
jgi:hypothetical protein